MLVFLNKIFSENLANIVQPYIPPGIALEICLFFNKFLKFYLFLKSLQIFSFSESEKES